MTAQLEGVNLAQLPVMPELSERWSGLASGKVHLTTEGVGRVEVLQNLTGQGSVALRNVEFRGWDVGASVADGAAHEGVSRWFGGGGNFSLRNRKLLLDNLRLDGGKQTIVVNGSVDFARDAELLIKNADGERSGGRSIVGGRLLKVSGPLDAPLVTSEAAAGRSSVSIATP